jgi:hypothetical protein
VTADRAVRWATVAAVVAVAAVAAYVSYQHAVEVVTRNGEPGTIGRLYPAAIDGLIIAASMVLLDAARHGETAPALAWWLLGSGVAVTFAANVTYGVAFGVAGALWAAWPAAAFVGCYELLLLLVRASARRENHYSSNTFPPPVPGDAETAALASLRATIAAGNPLSQNQLAERFGLTRAQAARVRQVTAADMNGRSPEIP